MIMSPKWMDEHRTYTLFRYDYPYTLYENCFCLPEDTGKIPCCLFSNTLPIFPM